MLKIKRVYEDAKARCRHPILEAAGQGDVILQYSARDTEHNSALVLKSFLEEHMKK